MEIAGDRVTSSDPVIFLKSALFHLRCNPGAGRLTTLGVEEQSDFAQHADCDFLLGGLK